MKRTRMTKTENKRNVGITKQHCILVQQVGSSRRDKKVQMKQSKNSSGKREPQNPAEAQRSDITARVLRPAATLLRPTILHQRPAPPSRQVQIQKPGPLSRSPN